VDMVCFCKKLVPLLFFDVTLFQFKDNGLVPLEILRKIEEKYENDLGQLNTAFDAMNQCSSIGNCQF